MLEILIDPKKGEGRTEIPWKYLEKTGDQMLLRFKQESTYYGIKNSANFWQRRANCKIQLTRQDEFSVLAERVEKHAVKKYTAFAPIKDLEPGQIFVHTWTPVMIGRYPDGYDALRRLMYAERKKGREFEITKTPEQVRIKRVK